MHHIVSTLRRLSLGDRAFDLNYWKKEALQECEILEKELKALLVRALNFTFSRLVQ